MAPLNQFRIRILYYLYKNDYTPDFVDLKDWLVSLPEVSLSSLVDAYTLRRNLEYLRDNGYISTRIHTRVENEKVEPLGSEGSKYAKPGDLTNWRCLARLEEKGFSFVRELRRDEVSQKTDESVQQTNASVIQTHRESENQFAVQKNLTIASIVVAIASVIVAFFSIRPDKSEKKLEEIRISIEKSRIALDSIGQAIKQSK